MVIEAAVAIGAGVMAGSLVLLAFGLDSVIELISAGVLIWRLSVELRHGQAFSKTAERTASRIGGGRLFARRPTWWWLPGGASGTGTARRSHRLASCWRSCRFRFCAIANRKLAVADRLGSRAMRADAMESITCGWLSLVVVVSLAAQALLDAWRVDGVGSLAIVWLLVKEGREAWAGEECGCG